MAEKIPQQPTATLIGYLLGECAYSLVVNGIFGFSLLFSTNALGLDPKWAGVAMAAAVFWEALTEPIMGYISDRTHGRWGSRHPYILGGGLLMALCSYWIWTIPAWCHGSPLAIFSYWLAMNLILRTSLSVFFIPYMALGFEMVQADYQRLRLQGLRRIFNMAANFAGPALAWILFFGGKTNEQATHSEANYQRMGSCFAIATAILVACVVIFTWPARVQIPPSPRMRQPTRRRIWDFLHEMKSIIGDPNARWIFVFIFIICVGMVLVSSLQMFVYDDFMKFSAWQKFIVHGGTMVAVAAGAFCSIRLSQRFDKKTAIWLGGGICIFGNVMLVGLFLTGVVKPTASAGTAAMILFGVFHASYWFGNGIMLPISNAMLADASEIRRRHNHKACEGSYAAVFSLAMRLAISLGLLGSGWCLSGAGYQAASQGRSLIQPPHAIWNLAMAALVISSGVCFAGMAVIWRYPLTRGRLAALRSVDNLATEFRPKERRYSID
jgi:glycoside/pentoside/hexuronide:cation symporter, GPH family